MSFRNRCVVAGSNGLVNLSVPLEQGRNHRQLIKDTRISYSGRWQEEHLRTLESCYSRSPYFEFYREPVWKLVQDRPVFLLDKNMAILEWLATTLGITAPISLTGAGLPDYPPDTLDMRDRFLPKNFQDNPTNERYVQVFGDRIGFQPNLCILDQLFCNGPDLKNTIQATF